MTTKRFTTACHWRLERVTREQCQKCQYSHWDILGFIVRCGYEGEIALRGRGNEY